jgi:hypothetical protein
MLVSIFLACLMNVCASDLLTALWFHQSQMKPRFHHLFILNDVIDKFFAICVVSLSNFKGTPMKMTGTHLAQNL